MKNNKPVLIVLGEPNSVFIEILSKFFNTKLKNNNFKYPIILIGSRDLIKAQNKFLKRKLDFENLDLGNLDIKNLKKKIYLINVDYKFKKPFEEISTKSRHYINNCFKKALYFLNSNKSKILIKGPISKHHFLEKKYPGITEYIFDKSKIKLTQNPVMLIFNKKLSVSPITTHISLKNVNKGLSIKKIVSNVNAINKFYEKYLNKKPNIAVLGLNPHCETKSNINEENQVIEPAIRKLKQMKIKIKGPYSTDTFFLKNNLEKFNSVIGMYHDQVLTPFKTLYEFNASNITLGLPFLRITVDHGPNYKMLGKNQSNTKSLENIFQLIDSIR